MKNTTFPIIPCHQNHVDAASLAQFHAVYTTHVPVMVKGFYRLMDSIDGLRVILDRTERSWLHAHMSEFLSSMTEPCTEQEQDVMMQLGRVHFQLQIPMPWMSYVLHYFSSYVMSELIDETSMGFLTMYFERMRWRDWWIMQGYLQAQLDKEQTMVRHRFWVIQRIFLRALSRLAEWNDPYTREHVERVSRYAAWIARQIAPVMGWEEPVIQSITLAALVHDLGKVAMPGAMLFKPDRFSPGERIHIEEHALVGAQILEWMQQLFAQEFEELRRAEGDVSGLLLGLDHELEHSVFQYAADIAWCHHEHWNGNGYPRRLRGEEIPLAARIVAIADVIDALMMDRPYKKGWSKERVHDYLLEKRGSQFDPNLVDTVLSEWEVFPFESEDAQAVL